jgi:hypothetical protein
MAYDETLAERIRGELRDVAGITEKKMFGGLVFMTGGHLAVGVYGDGGTEPLDRAGPQLRGHPAAKIA